MPHEDVHTLIIGAGPAGLAAADTLTRAGIRPVVILERDATAGGLMRSISRGPFVVDIGRKELYSRNPVVDRFWSDILGSDYRPYPHRFGTLYRGHIIESSSTYRGFRRGMPWPMFVACGLDLAWSWMTPALRRPRNYEEYMHRNAGRALSRITAQPFLERFNGVRWASLPVPDNGQRDTGPAMTLLRRAAGRAAARGTTPIPWRHPARGTGQICSLLEERIREAGGRFVFGASVTGITAEAALIRTVEADVGHATVTYRPGSVVAAVPIEVLGRWLGSPATDDEQTHGRGTGIPRRSTILVYLFLDEPPRFPHAWIEVTTPGTHAGRITNYAAFNGDMVPPGKTALCVEFFCAHDDPVLRRTPAEMTDLALRECAASRLLDPSRCLDSFVLKLPGADAAVSRKAWQGPARSRLTASLRRFTNLYFVNQPGTDHATFAGLEAAAAIMTGDRARFDQQTAIDVQASDTL